MPETTPLPVASGARVPGIVSTAPSPIPGTHHLVERVLNARQRVDERVVSDFLDGRVKFSTPSIRPAGDRG